MSTTTTYRLMAIIYLVSLLLVSSHSADVNLLAHYQCDPPCPTDHCCIQTWTTPATLVGKRTASGLRHLFKRQVVNECQPMRKEGQTCLKQHVLDVCPCQAGLICTNDPHLHSVTDLYYGFCHKG